MMRHRRLGHAVFAALLLTAANPGTASTAPVVRAPSGALAGVDQGKTHAFLGIPYAKAPVGPLRWKSPQPLPAWRGVRQATRFGHNCWQAVSPRGFGPWTHEYVVQGDISEDCLFLNVWAPTHVRGKLPVLVWIHGGGFNSGSGAIPIYDGRALAGRGIVIVTINYRVGLFGFLAHPDLTREAAGGPNANFGLQDMIAALKWVRANIGAFHGDPRAVTIAGQSAGSMAVHELLASPLARGLFARAISESGLLDPGDAPPLAQAEAAGRAFASEKGATNIAELRAMPAEALVASKGGNQVRFVPILDGVLLPALQPISRVPTLVGFTADEGSALGRDYGSPDLAALQQLLASHYGVAAARFAPFYPASTAEERAESNRQLRRDSGAGSIYAWAERRGAGPPIFAYRWTHIEPGPQADHWLAFHSSEIPYVFQTLSASPERGFTSADRLLSRRISTYWLNFIRSGDPNGSGLPAWPRLDLNDPRILEIGHRIGNRPLLPPDRMKAMRDFVAAGGNPSIF